MAITLKIVSYQRLALAAGAEKSIGREGATFGRALDCDWVFPDVERIVSGQHGRIFWRDGRYFVTDTSTNGLFLNDSANLIGEGQSRAIGVGDRLFLGDYEVEVVAESAPDQPDASSPEAAPAAAPSLSSSAAPDDELDWPDFGADSQLGPGDAQEASDTAYGKGSGKVQGQDSASAALPEPLLSAAFSPRPAVPDAGPPMPQAAADQADAGLPAAEHIPEDWNLTGGFAEAGAEERFDRAASPAGADVPVSTADTESVGAERDRRLDAFLRGAGLSPEQLAALGEAQLWEDFGVVFRELVDGVMTLLAERARFKREFHLDQTIILPIENNPLKFSPNVDEALRHLFVQQGRGFLSPVEAVREGVADIQRHHLATIAAIQTAYAGLLASFDPLGFEHADAEQMPKSWRRPGGKSRAWDRFCAFHQQALTDPDRGFMVLFGETFAQAYDEHLQRMAEARDNGEN